MQEPPRYLLDTNILSDLIRHPSGKVAQRIAQVGEDAIGVSIIVACEARYGALKKNSPRLTAKVEALLTTVPVLPLEMEGDRRYAELRCGLEAAGTPISANDMLIAAHALALGATLVTNNTGEFNRVDGLVVENWLD